MVEKKTLSIAEAAGWLSVTARTIYRLLEQGKLPGFKVGGQWRFSQEMLEAWVADGVTSEWLKADEKRKGSG